jgi:4'-phosphopantetheinyl transferase
VYGSEVHVWLVDVDDDAAARQALHYLPAEERVRLSAMLQPHQRRGICAQAALRILAGAATTGTPPLPELVRGWNGKPILLAWGLHDTGKPRMAAGPMARIRGVDTGADARAVHVSLSHSGAIAAVALTTAGITGVDVEQLRHLPDGEAMARSSMSKFEYLQWRVTRESRRNVAVFRAWTRKEAVLKALGTGLGGGLRSVSAPLEPARSSRVMVEALPEDAGPSEHWSVHDLPGWFGYVAAVAVRAPDVTVHQHEIRIGELLRVARAVPAEAAEAVALAA